MELLSDPNVWISLLTLTVLEIVLGIDNIIFISILASRLEKSKQPKARRLGLMGAFVSRLGLLASIAWIAGLTDPLFTFVGRGWAGRDLILVFGGLFLIGKAVLEIHHKLEPQGATTEEVKKAASSMLAVVSQIMVIDIVFSLDSVITAVGMAEHLEVMIAANVIALGVMLAAVTPVSEFVEKHPTVKMLALAFLVLIGTNLVAEGFGQHISKGYTYFAMAFSVLVEMLNLRLRKSIVPVELRVDDDAEPNAKP
jgi:predicted tellurium resistance membrane protein TerC